MLLDTAYKSTYYLATDAVSEESLAVTWKSTNTLPDRIFTTINLFAGIPKNAHIVSTKFVTPLFA